MKWKARFPSKPNCLCTNLIIVSCLGARTSYRQPIQHQLANPSFTSMRIDGEYSGLGEQFSWDLLIALCFVEPVAAREGDPGPIGRLVRDLDPLTGTIQVEVRCCRVRSGFGSSVHLDNKKFQELYVRLSWQCQEVLKHERARLKCPCRKWKEADPGLNSCDTDLDLVTDFNLWSEDDSKYQGTKHSCWWDVTGTIKTIWLLMALDYIHE